MVFRWGQKFGYKFGILEKWSNWTFTKDLVSFMCNEVKSLGTSGCKQKEKIRFNLILYKCILVNMCFGCCMCRSLLKSPRASRSKGIFVRCGPFLPPCDRRVVEIQHQLQQDSSCPLQRSSSTSVTETQGTSQALLVPKASIVRRMCPILSFNLFFYCT